MDYQQYTFSKVELIYYGLRNSFLVVAISYLMYKNIIVSLASLIFVLPLLKQNKKACIAKQKRQLLLEFREFLYSLIVCLGSGYSIENSLPHVVQELEMLYTGETMIIEEVRDIHRRICLGASVDDAFRQFSQRTDSTIIHLFVASLSIGINQGGNLVEVLKENSNMIIDQVSIHQEIDVITAEKQFELKFLSIFPFFIIALLDYSSPSFMGTLYTTWLGRFGMTLAMLVIGTGIFLGKQLVDKHT